jgi:hypothetical protein
VVELDGPADVHEPERQPVGDLRLRVFPARIEDQDHAFQKDVPVPGLARKYHHTALEA